MAEPFIFNQAARLAVLRLGRLTVARPALRGVATLGEIMLFSGRKKKDYKALDKTGFAKEIERLIGGRKKSDGTDDGLSPEDQALLAANEVLLKQIAPLFDAYSDLLKSKGKMCEVKFHEANIEIFPRRRPSAEFFNGLLGVPGVSDFYFRLENEGDGWILRSRPRLDGKSTGYDNWQVNIPYSARFASSVETYLQQFIRMTV
jgi:hypothetical protein